MSLDVIDLEKVAYEEIEEVDKIIYHQQVPFTGVVEALYEDGKRYYHYSYKNGILHGPMKKWKSNGDLSHVVYYEDGKYIEMKFPHQYTKNEIENL